MDVIGPETPEQRGKMLYLP